MSDVSPTSLHLHIDAIPHTDIHIHLETKPGTRSIGVKRERCREFVNTMVHEIVRHPQIDFATCLAYELGVGDLFEDYLMEQGYTHRTIKEKVQFNLILQYDKYLLFQAYHLMKLWRSAEGKNATKSKMLDVLENKQRGRPIDPTS